MLVVSPAGSAAYLCSGPLQAGVLLEHRRLQLVGLCLGVADLLHGGCQRLQPHVYPRMRSHQAHTSCRRLFSSERRWFVAASFSWSSASAVHRSSIACTTAVKTRCMVCRCMHAWRTMRRTRAASSALIAAASACSKHSKSALPHKQVQSADDWLCETRGAVRATTTRRTATRVRPHLSLYGAQLLTKRGLGGTDCLHISHCSCS
jgi:hypothetical protein